MNTSDELQYFRMELEKLRLESEELLSVYPIQDLFMAKQAEVQRMLKFLKLVDSDHPDKSAIESMVEGHIVERDQLKALLEETLKKFENHKNQIDKLLVKSHPQIRAPEY